MKLHVSMIVRNESKRYIHRSLECAREIVDISGGVLSITDDASEDDTADICESYGAIVRRSESPTFWQHEGKARQANFDIVSRYCDPGDWILSLDADETISSPQALCEMAKKAQNRGKVAILLPLYEFWTNSRYRTDGYWFGTKASRCYAWREEGKIADKAMGCGSEPTYVARAVASGGGMLCEDVHLLHWGYLRKEDRIRKHAAYTSREHGHNNDHVNSIITEPTLVRYEG